MIPEIKIRLLREGAKVPMRGHIGDAGWDLFLCDKALLAQHVPTKLSIGIAVQMPFGYEMQIRPRSSASVRGVHVAFGTVDSGYRGEICIIATYTLPGVLTLDAGSRIAQAVIQVVSPATWQEVEELDTTARGNGGFGSTGR